MWRAWWDRANEETEDCRGHWNHPGPQTTLFLTVHRLLLALILPQLALTPAKGTWDLRFQWQHLGVCINAIKGDIKGGLDFCRVLIAEDVDFHLIVINCRSSRTKACVSLDRRARAT